MKNAVFKFEVNTELGGISLLSLTSDPYGMNFIKNGRTLGTLRSFDFKFVTDFKVKSVTEEGNVITVISDYNGINAKTEYVLTDIDIKVNCTLKNENYHPVYIRKNELGVNIPFNDSYENSEICMKERCSTHIFAGLDSSYIRAERMGDSPYNLGLVLTKGQFVSYSQEEVKHSNRGFFVLNLPEFFLYGGESYEFGYSIFTYTDYSDFLKKIKTYDTYLYVDAPEGFTRYLGEKVEFSVVSKNAINKASCVCNGEPIDCEIEDNHLKISFIADKFGNNEVVFTVDGKKSMAHFNITLDEEVLIERRLNFIVDYQQCMDEKSPLYGAFLIYDNEEKCQYYNAAWRDYNACRERFGMAILLAKWLKTHENQKFRRALDLFTAFLLRESADEETGEVYDGIGKNPEFLRLYNAPWVALYFTELYNLTLDVRFARIVFKVLKYYYSVGGAKFYPNGIRFYEFVNVLKRAGLKNECEEVSVLFDEHVKNIVKNGTLYPPHEVNFEQTIVTPAATIMLDKYQISGDEFYLKEAQKHLMILRKFDGCQPDYRLHNIPIRFWDACFFGKCRMYSDTFPHYWSTLSGYDYHVYGKLTGNKQAVAIGRECIRNCTCLFTETGTASCAYVYPFMVNGKRGQFFDVYANDQDFALYFLLKINEEADD